MDRFRDRAEESRYRFEDDLRWARYRADQNRARVEDTFTDVYEAFTDPEVQKCFMTMGFNFVMGMSALMRKMPGPGFAKDAAEGFETSWRKASCSANPDCGVRKKKIEIDDDKPTGAVQIKFDEEE